MSLTIENIERFLTKAKMSIPTSEPSQPMRTDEQSEMNYVMKKYSEARADCINEENINEVAAKQFEETQKVTPELHCFAGCVGYKTGIIKKEGGFNEEAWKGFVSRIGDDEKRQKLLRVGTMTTNALEGLDRCESGNELSEISHVLRELKDYE
ncbi:uncharacterized protein N7484_011318 [Penicillium longicatenatum]|uniref:uncharacterized protein n=1 Tax=Penicillium longicatenatum TaxID=1561947 RepID=UPI002549A8BC|nr:uncharacterized protein N7484_011318 [Penicillium longicatenatum]KAJ5631218.1 hypothetical protein N7484_011318 [Penicillium longicatenatum]